MKMPFRYLSHATPVTKAAPAKRLALMCCGAAALFLSASCWPTTAAETSSETAPALKVEPRWGTVWVAPQLKGNWVMLRFISKWTAENAPTGKVVIELPLGVKCASAIAMPFQQDTLPGGGVRVTLSPVKLIEPETKGGLLYLSTTLKPGAAAKGRVWAEWEGGKTEADEFDVKVVDASPVALPKKIWTGAAVWPYMINSWPDYYRQYASLGFNHQNLWHGAYYGRVANTDQVNTDILQVVNRGREAGIWTSINMANAWGPEVEGPNPDPNTQSLFTDGSRGGPDPAYRGPLYDKWLEQLARIAQSGVSFVLSDEETYASGNFLLSSVSPASIARWKEWLKVNRPGMAYMEPKEFLTRQAEYPEQYRAWLFFRASLTTERYKMLKVQIDKAVSKYGAKSSPKPMLGWWAGAAEDWTLINAQQDGRSLSKIIDPVLLQLYFRYNMPPAVFRDNVRRHAWATQARGFWAGIDADDHLNYANTPGLLTAAVLETLMAGGKGYCMWAGCYMDTRQWAELSKVNGIVARYENTFLDGKETDLFRVYTPEGKGDLFHPYSHEVFASTRETKDMALLLISDYRRERKPFHIERSTAYSGAMSFTDAFTGAEVAKLAANQWELPVDLKASPVMLLVWKKNTGWQVMRLDQRQAGVDTISQLDFLSD